MPTTTARNIVKKALKKLSVLGYGESLQSEDAKDGLEALNDMLGSWSMRGGVVYTENRETFPLTGALSYTIGSGGNFDTVRPYEITSAYVTQGGTDYGLTRYNSDEYAGIADKDTQGIPDYFYYDNNHPLGNIFLYPVGDANYTVTLYTRKPLTEFTSLDTSIDLPDGFERALVYNLAIELAPEYEREASTSVKLIAGESFDAILTYNNRNNTTTSSVDSALMVNNTYNIYSGE